MTRQASDTAPLAPGSRGRPTASNPGSQPGRRGAPQGAMHEIASSTLIGAYLKATSQPIYSLLFLLPLLMGYELTAVWVNFDRNLQIRNAADIMIKNLLLQFGIRSMLGFMMAVVAIAIVAALIALKDTEDSIQPRYFGGMLIESLLYASMLGTLASRCTDLALGVPGSLALAPGLSMGPADPGFLSQIMIALGAGVYEEIVFRVLLISVLLSGFDVFGRLPFLGFLRGPKGSMLAAFLAALLFSGFHYMGAYGEPFLAVTFVYRFFAGLILAGIYVTRGLGIAAWTHAIYDVMVLLGVS